MKLEQTFAVQAPLSEVWTALVDVQRVAPCLPGAEITDVTEEGVYHGSFAVKLGPTTAAYRGTVRLETVDEAAHTATMKASGQDKRGQGGANATIVSRLSESDGATQVDVVTDFTITGRLARFGRGGMIEDISNRLLRDFADCLAKTLDGADAPASGAPAPASGAPSPASQGPAPESRAPAPARAAQPVDPAAGTGSSPGPPPPEAQPVAPAFRSGSSPPAPRAAQAKPVNGLALLLSVLRDRIRRLFGGGGR
jgi:carbon monoxide dehydrogenase subunit G